MRKAAVVGAAGVCVWFVFTVGLCGAAEGFAPDSPAPGQKPCPPFIARGGGSSDPWCLPRIGGAGAPPIVTDRMGRARDLPSRTPEEATTSGAAQAPEDVLLGVTWGDSSLVSFDPARGEVIREHALLKSDQAFTGLAYDRIRHRLYALSQGTFLLTIIDTDTLQTIDVVNLRVDTRLPGLTDTVALALDPATDTLYTIVGHWTNYPLGPIWSELATIDRETGELAIIGRIDGPWIASLAFSETDRQLYGIGVYGAGSFDSPDPTHVFWIDPETAESSTLFVTPYHTMLGFAVREPFTFFSWINWTSHFYGRTDLPTHTVTPLGLADGVDVIYAMLYESFTLPAQAVPIPPVPASFAFSGSVSSVWDPEGRLGGRVTDGQRFTGQFSYDAAAPFKTPDPNSSPSFGLSLSVNGLKYSSRGLTATITNDRYDWNRQSLTDSFRLAATANPTAAISWTLFDPTGEALSGSGKLPMTFRLPDWESNVFTVTGYDECCFRPVYAFSGTVDQVTRRDRRALQASLRPRPPIGRKPSQVPHLP